MPKRVNESAIEMGGRSEVARTVVECEVELEKRTACCDLAGDFIQDLARVGEGGAQVETSVGRAYESRRLLLSFSTSPRKRNKNGSS